MRSVRVLCGVLVLCGLLAVLATGCAGDDDDAGGQPEDSSTQVRWTFPGGPATTSVPQNDVDSFFTEERLRGAPNADELPILPGAPDESADPDEGIDGPPASFPPVAPGGERVSRAALVQPPSGRPARAQRRPWRYLRKRWTGRHDTLPMSTSGTFFIRDPRPGPYQGQIVQWCSGTVVASASKSLVWTAAHCFYDPKTKVWFDTDVVFVPGYKKGNRPFGAWRARSVAVHPRWLKMRGEIETWSHDVAAVVLAPRDGQFVQDVLGAQGIWFNLGRGQRYVSNGYPVDAPFNGDSLFTCRARFGGVDRTAGTPASTGIGCDMTGGSSGGSWLIGLGQGQGRGLGWVFSVNSYGYGNAPEMYGPYHGKDALAFYRRWSQ